LVLEVKSSTPSDILCENLPSTFNFSFNSHFIKAEFEEFLNYVKELNFDETPDYNLQRKTFFDLYKKLGFKWDSVYDWNALSVEKPLPFPDKLRLNGDIPGCSPEIRA